METGQEEASQDARFQSDLDATGDEIGPPPSCISARSAAAALSTEEDEEGRRLGKRQREEAATGDDLMDCSRTSNTCAAKRQQSSAHSHEVLLCLPLRLDDAHVTPQQLANELARCLHESKHMLVKAVVDVLGSERSIELFTRTAETQMKGGILSADGDKKRAPGGVFFSLVKSSASEEERKLIFFKDKMMAARRAKKAKEMAERRKRKREEKGEGHVEEGELEHFKQDLGLSGEQREQHPPDRNMEKRWKKKIEEEELVEYTDLDNPLDQEDGCRLNEGWRNEFDDDYDDDFAFQLSKYQQLRRKEPRSKEPRSKDGGKDGAEDDGPGMAGDSKSLQEENIAADQFERTDVCDFGVDLSCNL